MGLGGAVLAIVVLGGCATDYRAGVTKFSEAVKTTRDGVAEIEAGMARTLEKLARDEYLGRPGSERSSVDPYLDILDEDCKSSSARCRLFVHLPANKTPGTDDEGARPIQIEVGGEVRLAYAGSVVNATVSYAEALVAIAGAESAEAAKESGEAALGRADRVSELVAKALEKGDWPRVPTVIEAGADLVGFVVGQYLKRRRTMVLKEVVTGAREAIGRLSAYGKAVAEYYGVASNAEKAKGVQDAYRELVKVRKSGYDANDAAREAALYDDLVSKVAAMDAALVITNKGIFDDLVLAHEALYTALANKSGPGLGEIDAFADAAMTFYEKSRSVADTFDEGNEGG